MAVIPGDEFDNDLTGTPEGDDISGLGGNDTVRGDSGVDSIDGGIGNDVLSGGEGGDHLIGGDGNDVIYGFDSTSKTNGSGDIDAALIASGISIPVFATSAPGDPDRLFVVEQHTGRIEILDLQTGTINPTAFLDIPNSALSNAQSQGLLGLAFDPGYETNRLFYVYYSNAAGDIVVKRYSASESNPDQVEVGSGDVILKIPHPDHDTHYAGWMAFGPDGMLYIAVGDGGGAGNPSNSAQDKESLLGKILRIDVHGDDFAGNPDRDYAIPDDNPFTGPVDGRGEIWAFGLRNPWRDSFDRQTGDLYIADVGQNRWEEVNYQSADSNGGENYGWKIKEGPEVFNDTVPGNPSPDDPSLVNPVFAYPHDAVTGGFSITGGYVYRGQSPGMQGLYFYADFVTNQLWSLRIVNGVAVDVTNRTAQVVADGGDIDSIVSFAEDGHGNLYVLQFDGEIHRLDIHAAAGDGNDTIEGGAGRDRVYGGAGDDVISGGRANDQLWGGEQNDSISGGKGADIIRGGSGDDDLTGGAAGDIFCFAIGCGNDTINDFTDDLDTIRLRTSLGVSDPEEALALAIESNGDVVFTFAGGEVLTVLNVTKAALENDIVVLA